MPFIFNRPENVGTLIMNQQTDNQVVTRSKGLTQLLGHSQPATTARYAHLQNESQRETANIFGAVYRSAKNTA